MTFSQLRREVDSLMRKHATELAAYRLRPVADEYCDQWQELIAESQLPPDPRRLFEKLPGNHFLRHRYPAVNNYLEDCRRYRRLPHPNEILRRLIPGAAALGLVPRELLPVAY